MGVNYKPLWKLLIDREMTRTALREASGVSTRAMAKMGRNEGVSTDVLSKICITLGCQLSDIVEVTSDKPAREVKAGHGKDA